MATDKKIFLFDVVRRDRASFRRLAEQAARLKPLGRVVIQMASLPEPTPYDRSRGVCPWHQYLCDLPALHKFVPHPRLQPHLDMKHVERNRQALAERAAVLAELGLEAQVQTIEPFFWPEEIFREHPAWRGPRVDHPRRSTVEEFAPCTDVPEVLEMYTWMAAELRKYVPMLASLRFRSNDAGSGFCWCAALYSGRNGPSACANVDPGVRVARFIEALGRGAGQDVRIQCNGNFYNNEVYSIAPKLGENQFLEGWKDDSAGLWPAWPAPIKSYVRPMNLINNCARWEDPARRQYNIGASHYQKCAFEADPDMDIAVELIQQCLERPMGKTLRARQERLHELCRQWAGDRADAAYEAFAAQEEAERIPTGGASLFYHGVTVRYITRPLVVRPELLSPEEESYFLPFVFNVRESEARMDYTDAHGSRFEVWPTVRQAIAAQQNVARQFEALGDAPPQGAWFKRLALAHRLKASILRSIVNFHKAQTLREQFAAQLRPEGVHVPAKDETMQGEPGNLEWNAVMRDELENAGEMLAILQAGGLELMCRAATAEQEETLALPTDLVGAVRKKMEIMRRHWRDVGAHLARR